MARTAPIDRRRFLRTSAVLGCSAAASPLLTPVSFAAAPWDARLVVIILRGGMDGLDVVQPYGDREFASLRGGTVGIGEASGDAQDLDGFFALHPALLPLLPLWTAGDLAVAHAVSTPYRDKRSHFDGQDLLEAGAGFGPGERPARDGWLNRMLQGIPGLEAETAFAIGQEDPLLLRGDAPVANWAPGASLALTPQAELLLEIVCQDDVLFRDAIEEALQVSGEIADGGAVKGAPHLQVAEFAAERLRAETRIAAFSINGWDTHRDQGHGLSRALGRLSDTILALQDGLGPVWGQTAVLAMTEFGRTVRPNGTGGTDHGTGGAMLMAGGAVRGGVVHGRWPGLGEADLYQRRDLLPTADVRGYAAAVMRELLGIDRTLLETTIFPGLRMEGTGGVIL
ncbi:DUF1501 domain-containing protein [Tropicimonas isoalkanivorans]|uniref:Tat (Twin-arginine translocation) pathway signal sequence n=1 Tax=Tropicimonas isoalkanivorans TaxID=441112 RepID=A0A1I1EGT5_9RHOB|nr:DUF1501 domain-containing protein [Tropicimonas isoalkanivorans]SFB84180.1 Tat (twin-arginine translocation) pathway signal sequence [Tropicimonas isoalkanivorans]